MWNGVYNCAGGWRQAMTLLNISDTSLCRADLVGGLEG